MEKYTLPDKRKFLMAGLAAIVLLIPSCQTLKIEPVYYQDFQRQEMYMDKNTQE